MNSTSGLVVNLATDSTGGGLSGWGWQNAAYWLSQPTSVTFTTSGMHTMRIQVREDGVQLDQIVLSQSTYLNAAPGPLANDNTIVPKSNPPQPPAAPTSPNPANTATAVSATATLSWTASGATSYEVSFGAANPPPQVVPAFQASVRAPSGDDRRNDLLLASDRAQCCRRHHGVDLVVCDSRPAAATRGSADDLQRDR